MHAGSRGKKVLCTCTVFYWYLVTGIYYTCLLYLNYVYTWNKMLILVIFWSFNRDYTDGYFIYSRLLYIHVYIWTFRDSTFKCDVRSYATPIKGQYRVRELCGLLTFCYVRTKNYEWKWQGKFILLVPNYHLLSYQKWHPQNLHLIRCSLHFYDRSFLPCFVVFLKEKGWSRDIYYTIIAVFEVNTMIKLPEKYNIHRVV